LFEEVEVMDNIKEIDSLNIVEACSDLKLVGFINGKEQTIEIDKICKAMIIGYLSKKNRIKH
jgi:hypothetical protein